MLFDFGFEGFQLRVDVAADFGERLFVLFLLFSYELSAGVDVSLFYLFAVSLCFL